jgi:hypothetical protein
MKPYIENISQHSMRESSYSNIRLISKVLDKVAVIGDDEIIGGTVTLA